MPKETLPTANEDDLMSETASQLLFDQLVTTYYLPMEIWYTRTIIDKVSDFSCGSNVVLIEAI